MARRRKTKFRRRVQLYMRMGITILILIMVAMIAMRLFEIGPFEDKYTERTGSEIDAWKPEIDVELLTINEYSRPGTQTGKIKGIVIHYTANPGSTAMQNRNYFEGLKELTLNDEIIYTLLGEQKHYKITNIEIIHESDWSYLEKTKKMQQRGKASNMFSH